MVRLALGRVVMDVWDTLKLVVAGLGLVASSLLVLHLFRKPTLQVTVESAVAEPRSGPRLYYQINLTLRALYGPVTLQRIRLTHERVPGTQLQVNYALGEYVTRDLLALPTDAFLAETQHHLGDKPSSRPRSIRLPGLTLAKGKRQALTFAGFIPFIASNRQLDLIPIEGWDLEFATSAGVEHVAVFTPYERA